MLGIKRLAFVALAPILVACALVDCTSAAKPCSASAECEKGESCFWTASQTCDSKGGCYAPASGTNNAHFDLANKCGCDGTMVSGSTLFPKPVTSSLTCFPHDGLDAATDAADTSSDGGNSTDAPVDALEGG
jgi:hypothetical protein